MKQNFNIYSFVNTELGYIFWNTFIKALHMMRGHFL